MSNATPEMMVQSMLDNMPQKTGKSMQDWLKIVRKQGTKKHGEIVSQLKSEFGIGHGFANLIAHTHLASGSPPATDGGLLDAQYAGTKAALRPVYDAVEKMVKGFGKDVEIAPKKTYVSLRRSKQFALIQASTKDRVDVGINLKGVPPGPRLEASGSFNTMVSHRVRLSNKADVDNELKGWLRKAYDAA